MGHVFLAVKRGVRPNFDNSFARFVIHSPDENDIYTIADDNHMPLRITNTFDHDVEIWYDDGFEMHPKHTLAPGEFFEEYAREFSTYVATEVGNARGILKRLLIQESDWKYEL